MAEQGPYTIPDFETLLANARMQTGIAIEDAQVREPLSRYVASVNSEGQLHEEGARFLEHRVTMFLKNRLRYLRDLAAHPEIAEQVIDRPIIICGIGRSGSTKTQKLLAASGDFNWLKYWHTMMPSLITGDRSEDPAERIAETDAYCERFDTASPESRYGHSFETHEPEEDSALIEHSFASPVAIGWCPIWEYLGWLATTDMLAQLEWLRDALRYLQWQGLADPGKRWVLKCPLYPGMEGNLIKVFPDAKLLSTHRHPEKTLASGLRLLETFHAPFSTAQVSASAYFEGIGQAMDAHLALRDGLPAGTMLDIDFNALMADLGGALRRIYAFIGEPLDEAKLARMLAQDAARPADKYGKHKYTLEQFGMTREGIAERYAAYIALLEREVAKPVSA